MYLFLYHLTSKNGSIISIQNGYNVIICDKNRTFAHNVPARGIRELVNR